MVLGLLMHGMPSNFFSRILGSEALVYKSFFFFRTAVLQKLFEIRFSYKHCNFSRVCLLVKMASKTVTRSISDDLNETLLLEFDMLPLSVEISDETLLIVFDIFDSYIVLVFGYQMKYSLSGKIYYLSLYRYQIKYSSLEFFKKLLLGIWMLFDI